MSITVTTPDITAGSLNGGALLSILHLSKLTASSTNVGAVLAAYSTPKNVGASANAGALQRILHRSKLTGGSLNAGSTSSRLHLSKLTGVSASAGTARAGRDEAPCDFSLAEMRSRVWTALDDAPEGLYYTPSAVNHALNAGQRLFALLTLCIERTVTFTLVNGQNYYLIDSQISDFLAVLRVSHNGGVRLVPDTIHSLDSRDATWRARAGAPKRYAQEGFNAFWVTPQPASGSNTLSLTYAAMPTVMVADADVPEIPGDQQAALLDFAYFWLRLKEGGVELQNAAEYLKRFLATAEKYQKFVRTKSRGQLYDRQPPVDLSTFDRGRFAVKLARQMAMVKKQKEDSK